MTTRALVVTLFSIVGLLVAGVAQAAWTGVGHGAASAASDTIAAPTGVAATLTAPNVGLSWSAPATGVAPTSYALNRTRTLPAGTTVPACSGATVTTTSCTDPSLPEGRWTYVVRSQRSAWSSGWSAASNPVDVVPNTPTSPARSGTANPATITWTDTSAIETGFVLQRSVNGGAWTSAASVATNAVQATDGQALTCGVTTGYRVVAVHSTIGSSIPSGVVNVTGPACATVRIVSIVGSFDKATGTATIKFAIDLRDAQNAPVSGVAVTGTVEQSGSGTSSSSVSCTSGPTGLCEATVVTFQGNVNRAVYTLTTVTPPAGYAVGTHSMTTATITR